MKKILRLCIVLAMLGITYKYIETVGVYQTEVAKVQKIGANNGGLIEAVIITAESDWADIRDIINNRRENEKAIAIYYPLLAEYERAWKDKDYYDEYGYIISDYRFRYLRNSLEYNSLWYVPYLILQIMGQKN